MGPNSKSYKNLSALSGKIDEILKSMKNSNEVDEKEVAKKIAAIDNAVESIEKALEKEN